jgi:hypothetical protein
MLLLPLIHGARRRVVASVLTMTALGGRAVAAGRPLAARGTRPGRNDGNELARRVVPDYQIRHGTDGGWNARPE